MKNQRVVCHALVLDYTPNAWMLTFLLLATAYENIDITTRSHPDAFPSALRQKRKTQTKTHEATEGLLKVYIVFLTSATLLTVADCRSQRNVPSADIWKPSQKRYRCVLFRQQISGDLTDYFQMRSADEGSTILYTVRAFTPRYTDFVPQLMIIPVRCV